MHFKNLKRALQSLPASRAASDFAFFIILVEDVEHNQLLSPGIWL